MECAKPPCERGLSTIAINDTMRMELKKTTFNLKQKLEAQKELHKDHFSFIFMPFAFEGPTPDIWMTTTNSDKQQW